jgi:hypothetical protein
MAAPTDLFSLLSARYGVSAALSLMSLFSPDAGGAQKAFGAAGALGTGAQAFGALSGNPSLSALGDSLGKGLGLAGAGYGLYQTATNPNLSTGQKVGHSGVQAGEAVGSLLNPYVGAGVAAKAVIDQLRQSGSPQVAATGRALGGPALPVEGLLSVLQGDASPRAAFNNMVTQIGQVPVVGGMLGSGLRMFGLGTKPTTGTMFRNELGSVLNQIPSLKGADITKYGAPDQANTLNYSMYDPKAVTAGQQLGKILAAYAPSGKQNPDAYGLQAENILLGNYGNQLSSMLPQILAMLQPKQTAQKVVA